MAEKILITGGSGFIGLELTRNLAVEGHDITILDLKPPGILPCNDGRINFAYGDITNISQVLTVVRDCKPDVIIHLAALLSEPSERNPWASISVNATGTYHVLEAARIFGVRKVLFSSSMAVYLDADFPIKVVTEQTRKQPSIIYGVTKVFSELLALYYHRKFDLDTRGIRLPVLIGPNVESDGFGQFNSRMIQAAILGKPFEVNVPEDTVMPLLYIKDAVRSFIMLHHVPEDKVKTRIYNVGQIMPPPKTADLVNEIRVYFPDASIVFNPDPVATELVRKTLREIRCEEAQKEWGWQVSYSLKEAIADFISTFKNHEAS